MDASVDEEATRVARACFDAGATDVQRAQSEEERQRLWRARRELSPALKALAPAKLNHDVVVPKGLIPRLFTLVADLSASHGLLIPCFGHAGDGNIHVNIMADPDQPGQMERARLASGTCWKEWWRSAGRSAANTVSASRRRSFSGSNCRPRSSR